MTEYTLKLVSGPAEEPLSLDQAKYHLRVDTADDDDYITSLLTVSRLAIENEINRPIGEQTFEMGLHWWWGLGYPYAATFPQFTEREFWNQYIGGIEFPRAPFISLVSIKYDLDSGTTAVLMDTLASPPTVSTIFTIDDSSDTDPASIHLKRDETWPPDLLALGHPVKIRFTAGYTDVPLPLKQAMLLTIGHLYANRESVTIEDNRATLIELPQAVQWLCQPYKFAFYR